MSLNSFFLSNEDYFKNYLKGTPGVAPERFEAYKLPSLVNGKRVPYTGVKASLVSKVSPYVSAHPYRDEHDPQVTA